MNDLKKCPVCHASCFADMDICYGCLHRFTKEDDACACDFEPEQPSSLREIDSSDGFDFAGRGVACQSELPPEGFSRVAIGGSSDGGECSSYVEIEALLRIPREQIAELSRLQESVAS